MDQTTLIYYNWPSIRASDVAKYLKIPERRIKHYVELDIIPVRDKQPGTGNSRMFTPANVMEIVLMDRLEGIGITPKRLSRISKRLNEAVAGFIKAKAGLKYRYVHIAAPTGDNALVTWPATRKTDNWATLVIDLLKLQRDFDALLKRHWLVPVDLSDNARFVDI